MRRFAVATACCLCLGGCTTAGDPASTAFLGAPAGTVVDSQVGAGAGDAELGALEGGLLRADIGRSMDADERQTALNAEYEALEYARAGRPTTWRNARSGLSGQIVVGPTYEVNRLDCREFTHKVFLQGRARVAKGTACRSPDGDWRNIGY